MYKHKTFKIKILFVFILITLFSKIEAQQLSNLKLDSLYYLIVKNIKPSILDNTVVPFSVDTTHIKCGFGMINDAKFNLPLFSKKKRQDLQNVLSRPVTDTSFVTPNGFFRVHYNHTGADTPFYSMTDLAIALDSAYNFEINYLGYPPPPSDQNLGGDNRYDIYVVPIGGLYGYTEVETQVGENTWTSFMVINNNYSGFYTEGINAARVTVAHEFHHSIQAGNYIYRYNLDEFFYELTSTAMEHFVYPTIKDYLQYLPYYFYNTQNSISTNGSNQEYALAVWNIFQKDNYGYDIIKKEWQLMPQMRAMDAINSALQSYNTSFGSAFNNFGIWMYFTNYRSIPGEYFEDAAFYPVVNPIASLNFHSTSFPVQLSSGPCSNTFLNIINPNSIDTLCAIISNSDIQNSIDSTSSLYAFQYGLYNFPVNGSEKLNSSYFATFSADKPNNWTTSEILNNSIMQSSQITANQINYSFPSPFYYNKDSFIYIPITPDQTSDVQLYIYSISMKLVYFGDNIKLSYIYGQTIVKWDGLNTNNEKLSSGVYLYVVKSGNNISKGKLVILND